MCLYKKTLLNPKYLPNKKNGYNPPKCTDERFRYIEAECGQCYECRKKRAREWSIRIHENLKYEFGYFVTLTISPESMKNLMEIEEVKELKGNENAIAKLALRRCLERIRKQTGKSLKHWCVTELGEENDRIHLHGIVFGQRAAELIKQQWGYGIVYVGKYCSSRTANYITKYMLKEDVKHPWFTGRVFTSAGIGRGYIFGNRIRNRFRGKETDDRYQAANGQMIAMPKYYKNKLYSDEEREIIWGYKQEDKYTYIHGEKVRKTDESTIKNLTEYYRRVINKTMMDNPLDWEKRKKENKRQRRTEGYRKIRKEMYKDAIKNGVVRESVLINQKLREKKDKTYCSIKNYFISLQRNQRRSIIKQLELW